MGAVKQELQKFGETTTVKGVSRIIKSHNRIVQCLWLLALLSCFSLLLFQGITVFLNYSKFKVIRNSEVVLSQPEFPEVTVCNLFPVSDIQTFPKLYELHLKRLDFIRNQSQRWDEQYTGVWDYLRLLVIFNTNIPIVSDFHSSSTLSDDFVVQCDDYSWDIYGYRNCTQNWFVFRPIQLCKTLQARRSSAAIRTILFLDDFLSQPINSFYNFLWIPFSAGVRVMIHPRGTRPDPASAIYVFPGTELVINIKQTNITRLPYPYGNCSDRHRLIIDDKSSPAYDRPTCISLCRQRQVLDACGCLDPLEYFMDDELEMNNYTFCTNFSQLLQDSTQYLANGIITDDFWNLTDCFFLFIPNEDLCDCPIRCSEIQYELTSSVVRWPHIYYQLAFYDVYLRNDNRYTAKFASYEKIRESEKRRSGAETLEELKKVNLIERNFIQVSVKMQEKSVQIVNDIAAISWDTMASNIGGSLNLWLGISVLTVAELIELIYSLAKIGIRRKRADGQVPCV